MYTVKTKHRCCIVYDRSLTMWQQGSVQGNCTVPVGLLLISRTDQGESMHLKTRIYRIYTYIYRVGQKKICHWVSFLILFAYSDWILPNFAQRCRVQFDIYLPNLVNFCSANPKLRQFEDAYPLFISANFTGHVSWRSSGLGSTTAQLSLSWACCIDFPDKIIETTSVPLFIWKLSN